MTVPGVVVTGPSVPGAERVLTDDALAFIARPATAVRRVAARSHASARGTPRPDLLAGGTLDFLPGTREIREADWTVAPAPADFDDRRVEITGPAEPKMMINALNSGARVFMADIEDALSPTWANVVGGQAALQDAVRGTLAYDAPDGKAYRLGDRVAHAGRPAARLAPDRIARARGRGPDLGVAVRCRAVPVPQRRRAGSSRLGAVSLPPQARVAPRGAALE